VALGGDGADELFAGYDPFRALRYAEAYARFVPRPVHRGIAALAARLPVSHSYMSADFRIKRTLRGLDYPAHLWLPVWMAPLAPGELQEIFGAPVDLEDLYSEAIETWDACASPDPIDRTIAFYIRLYLQDDILVKVDRASMLNSLEVRAPFLDCELVDFLRRLPSDMKLRGGTTKYLLRKAAARLLPAPIVARAKQGFAVPIGQWFRDDVLPPRALAHAVNAPFWRDRLGRHRALRTDERMYLWSDWLLGASHLGGVEIARP
jgi:asparagine synthase (glutamine-hydrolysing)